MCDKKNKFTGPIRLHHSKNMINSNEGSLHTAIFPSTDKTPDSMQSRSSTVSPQVTSSAGRSGGGSPSPPSLRRGEKCTTLSISPLRSRSAQGTSLDDNKNIDFSMELYRELHQRQFYSINEELTFLRNDFIASRKTLTVLNEETRRLHQVLRERTREIRDLKEKLEWYERHYGSYQDLLYKHSVDRGVKETLFLTELDKGDSSVTKGVRATSEEPIKSDRALTELSLYAAAASAVSKITKKGGASSVNDLNTVELINELRRNLARRDTALEQCKLELSTVKHTNHELESTSNQHKKDLEESLKEKRELRVELERKADVNTALGEQLRVSRETIRVQEKELTDLRKKVELAEMLRGHYASTETRHTSSVSPSHVGSPGNVSEMDYLYEQVRSYRAKWQTAEERIDELRRQLQKQDQEGVEHKRQATASASLPLSEAQQRRYETEIRDQLETIHRLQRKLDREQERAAFTEEEQRRQLQQEQRQHVTEINTLRSELHTAKDQLEVFSSQRDNLLQQFRGLTNSEEMETALRNQNEALRQRQHELTAELAQSCAKTTQLEADLQMHIAERVQLQRENKALYAEVQQLREREAMLQTEINRLREEIGASKGRVYALERIVSHPWSQGEPPHASTLTSRGNIGDGEDDEVLSKDDTEAISDDDVEVPSLAPFQMRMNTDDEQKDNKNPRNSLMQASSSQAHYVTLMDLNTSLQQRLVRMEHELTTAFTTLQSPLWRQSFRESESVKLTGKKTEPIVVDAGRPCPGLLNFTNSNSEFNNETPDLDLLTQPVQHLVHNLLEELGQLQRDHKQARHMHKQLSKKWRSLRKEHKAVLEDNIILANGAEAIYKELTELKKREENKPRSKRSISSRVDVCKQSRLDRRKKEK